MTGYADVPNLVEGVLPAGQVVHKPFRRDGLLARIRAVFEEAEQG